MTDYPAWRDAHARVYFARVADYIKVGCSVNVKARLGSIRNPRSVKCPSDLPRDIRPTVLGTIPGGYDLEESVLTQLVIACGPESRAAGEWFHATPAVLAWIEQNVTNSPALPPPHAVEERAYVRAQALRDAAEQLPVVGDVLRGMAAREVGGDE